MISARVGTGIAPGDLFRYAVTIMKNKDDINDSDIVLEEGTKAGAAPVDDSSDLDDSVVAEEGAATAIKKLRDRLKQAETDKQEYLTGWQRAKADLVNARKRDEEERKEFMKFANERLIEDLVPVLESFDMAIGNTDAWEKADKNWRIGVEYIYSQLKKALSDNGLEEIIPVAGEIFDHSRHEAASYEMVKDPAQDHVIIGVVQKGYSLNGKVLKVPKVKVGEFAQPKDL